METEAELRARAQYLDCLAYRARCAAQRLELAQESLGTRLDRVHQLHVRSTWQGWAATQHRVALQERRSELLDLSRRVRALAQRLYWKANELDLLANQALNLANQLLVDSSTGPTS